MKRMTVSVLFMAVVLLSLSTGKAGAFNPADLAKLKATNACPRCNLTEADLAAEDLPNAFLAEADLSLADLSLADLSNANLSGAKLRETNLVGANLSGAKLERAKLEGANLSGATWTDGRTCASRSVGACK